MVRAYIESGEPVSSRAISRSHAEQLSPATIRNVMAELESGATSISRTPRPAACPPPRRIVFSRNRWWSRELSAKKIANGFAVNSTRRRPPEDVAERAGQVLAAYRKGWASL